jgi:hypothetical protein
VKVKQNGEANHAQKVKQIAKQRRTVVEQGNHETIQKCRNLRLKSQKTKTGNEWIWTTDQGLMSPLLYH